MSAVIPLVAERDAGCATPPVLKERGLKAPIGEVKALPDSQAPKS